MKKVILGFILMIELSAMGQIGMISVIPQPVDVRILTGSWTLTSGAVVSYNKPEGKAVADMLVKRLNRPTGFALLAKQGASGNLQLNLNSADDQSIGKEGYILAVSPKGVVISANTLAGLFYGMQTLLQLFPKEIESKTVHKKSWTVPSVNITDYPRFGWRGLMLDVSRNFFTVDEVKRYLDEMARYKFNTFHWHLTDDHGWRVEIKALPRLTEIGAFRVPRAGHFGTRSDPQPGEKATDGGFYTHEEIKDIVQYAAERHITIVPEIDVPGHSMAALAAYPELSTTKNTEIQVNPGTAFAEWYGDGTFKMFIENTLNPSDEKVYEFLDKVFTEIAQLFPNPYIHVGGDECYKGYWQEDSSCQALMKQQNMHHVEELQGYFMNRVEKILTEKGKKLLGWDEILEGGISPGATVMSWRGIKGGIEASQLGHDVVMTPTTFAYLDYTQGDPTVDPPIYASLRLQQCYSFNPVPEGAVEKHILGGQGNLWSEQIATLRHAEYMTWPRGLALAEVYWTPDERKNREDFIRRVEIQFKRCDIAEVNYSLAMFDAIVKTRMKNDKMLVEMAAEIPGIDLFYTIDGSMPDEYSPKYTNPFELPVGPVTLRVISYRNGEEIGHLITLDPEELDARAR
jgi:hexosaminidase